MNIQLSPKPSAATPVEDTMMIADCDIHPSPKSIERDIYPFLEKRWRDHIETYGTPVRGGFQSGTSYPKSQPMASRQDAYPPDGGIPGSDLPFMRAQHLDPNNVAFGVLIPLWIGQNLQNPDLSMAICRASNEWMVAEWTSKEPRLKGSIAVPFEDPISSAAEIDRLAGDKNFAQVSLLSRTAQPLGHRHYWPVYEAAERAGLPIGIHTFGHGGSPITGGGWPSYYMEEMSALAQSCQALVASMVLEGVFERFPKLKVILIEGGMSWLPPMMWRLDKLWTTLRSEVPHVKRPPSEYIREHVWLTSQPIEEPDNRRHLLESLEWIGWDRILFASDYPHWDFDDPAYALRPWLTKDQRRKFFRDNAQALYGFQ